MKTRREHSAVPSTSTAPAVAGFAMSAGVGPRPVLVPLPAGTARAWTFTLPKSQLL